MEIKTSIYQASKRPEKNAEAMAQVFASKMPNTTNFNNSKSNKYFSSKSSLCSNDPNDLSDNNGLSQSELNGMMTIKDSLLHGCKKTSVTSHQRQPSNLLRVSKEILKFSEKKSSPKIFYKIPAKWVDEDVFTEEDEDTTDREDSLTNRTADIIKYDLKDSVVEAKQKINSKLNNTDIGSDKKKNLGEFLRNINLVYFLEIENLYKQLEKVTDQSVSIDCSDKIQVGIYDQYQENISHILKVTDPINENETCSLIKEFDLFFSLELLIFSLLNLLKGSWNCDPNFTTGNYFKNTLKNCLFYLHQNFIVFLFVCLGENQVTLRDSDPKKKIPPKVPVQEIQDKNMSAGGDLFLKCKELIDNNRIWLNKNNYKKFLRTNNKTIKSILQNFLKEYMHKSESNLKWIPGFIYLFSNFLKNLGKKKPGKIKQEINKFFSEIKNEYFKNPSNILNNDPNNSSNNILNNDPNNCEEIKVYPPFLPQINENKIYTLVLDLDETLVHYVEDEESAYIQIRPGAEIFLDEMAKYFEIVVFTAAMQDVRNFLTFSTLT